MSSKGQTWCSTAIVTKQKVTSVKFRSEDKEVEELASLSNGNQTF